MSNNAAIAAVTATLTNIIQAAIGADATVSSGTVTARPPDRARQGAPVNQVNLFLYRTSIDAAWRNQDPPGVRPGESGQPPLPLVLSYLITAYGENDDEILAHRLLGIAMGVLNDRPVLSRAEIAGALPPPGSDLQNQVERVRVIPDPRPQDEISRMWTTFGTGYRLSVSYDVAVVLIDSTRSIAAPAPVLMRGAQDTGPVVAGAPFPQIQLAAVPNRQAAAQPGDVLTLTGSYLSAIVSVQVSHPLAAQPLTLTPLSVTPFRVTVRLPDPPLLPAGIATVASTFAVPLDQAAAAGPGVPTAVSNAVPVALAPKLVSDAPLSVKLAGNGTATLTVNCSPAVQPQQTIALIVGSRLVSSEPLPAASSQLSFSLRGFAAGSYLLRLRVDSVDSIPVVTVPVPGSASQPAPMEFDPNQRLVLS
jgi:Pvc16 N-terminal domain